MRETERNIRRYRKQLIHTKEKVITSIMLFVMSAVMLTTASLAWIVLSVKPAVSNIQTTIAGNGNLEIALAHSEEDGSLAVPEITQVGDGMLSLVEKNTTWGNLVNLGAEAYGLHKIVLRPAKLYTNDLLSSPLVAVAYGSDGRVIDLDNSGLRYSNYDATANNNTGEFVIEEFADYGVRAISSTKNLEFNSGISDKIFEIRNGSLKTVQNKYLALIDENINVVANIMENVMGDKVLNSTTNYYNDLDDIISLMQKFCSILEETFNFYAQIANHQLGNKYADGSALLNESIIQDFLNGSSTSANVEKQFKETYGVSVLKGLDALLNDYKLLTNHIKTLENVYTTETSEDKNVTWEQIASSVNFLVEIDSCEIYPDGFSGAKYEVGKIGTSAALGLLGGSDMKGLVTKGAIQRLEQLIGVKINVENLTLRVSFISMDADISTSSKAPFTSNAVLSDLFTYLNEGVAEALVAADNYGMVIDFWLRTNAKDSYIKLEGEPVTEERILTTLVEGRYYDCYVDTNDKIFYFVPVSGEGYTGTRDLAGQISDDERDYLLTSGTFWNYSTGQQLVFDETDSDKDGYSDAYATFVNETIIDWARETVVIGYDGENRVWEESENLIHGGTSATQGKGSCYIFYPSSVVEQEQMLKLLSGLTVVFIDSEGNLLTSAKLNTTLAYEDSGKVTVPLELVETSPIVDISGVDTRIITKIDQNEEKFISAIVYLDGELVTNDLVDAMTGVVGYLNIQFGSTALLDPMDNKDLQEQVIHVTGSLGENNVDEVTLSYGKDQLKTKVNINVSGTSAESVSVKFTRKINANQGVIMDEVPLTLVDGVWTSDAIFTNPGTYVLRSAWIDGIEYEFTDKKELKVDIEGLAIENVWLSTNTNNIYHMSDSNKYVVNVYTTVKANTGINVNTVQGLFRDSSGGYITVNMSNDSTGTWSSAVSFTKSGTYTLDTILINGDAYEIPKDNQKVITLNLGITTNITLSKKSEIYEGEPSETIKVEGIIKDGSGNVMNDLTNVYLTYAVKGSDINPAWSELKWNTSTKKYEGNIRFSSPGIYEFQSLGINRTVVNINPDQDIDEISFTNTISKATADSFAFVPMDPPSYSGNLTDTYQFAPYNDAVLSINIDNSISATIAANVVYVNQDGTEEEPVLVYNDTNSLDNVTKVTSGLTTTWNIKLPQRANTIQNGTWKLKEIRMIGVYVDDHMYMFEGDETWTTEDANYYSIDLTNKGIETYVVNNLNISVSNNKDKDFATDVFTKYVNGDYSRTNYKIEITDIFGNAIDDSSIKIDTASVFYDYTLDNSSGWNEASSVAGDTYKSGLTTQLIKSKAGVFMSSNPIKFLYPGSYKSRAEVSISDIDDSTNESSYGYTITMNDNRIVTTNAANTNVQVITVNNMIGNETVTWLTPDVAFVSGEYNSTGTPGTKGNVLSNNNKTITLDYSLKTTVTQDTDCNGNVTESTETSYYLSSFTSKINNAGAFSSASIDLSGSYQVCGSTRNQTITLSFSSSNTTANTSLDTQGNQITVDNGFKGNKLTIKAKVNNVDTTYTFTIPELNVLVWDY